MDTNGTGKMVERLNAVEQAITGGGTRTERRLRRENEAPLDDIARHTLELADRWRAAGRHAFEHGEHIQRSCNEHADRLIADQRSLAEHVLTAERKMLADSERFIGEPASQG